LALSFEVMASHSWIEPVGPAWSRRAHPLGAKIQRGFQLLTLSHR
jgi:hypothetical protein